MEIVFGAAVLIVVYNCMIIAGLLIIHNDVRNLRKRDEDETKLS